MFTFKYSANNAISIEHHEYTIIAQIKLQKTLRIMFLWYSNVKANSDIHTEDSVQI